MLILLLQILGRLTAHTPEPLLRLASLAVGDLLWIALPRRRRLVLSNLHHAFPERTDAWRRTLGRASSRRLAESGLLSLAMPFLSEKRLRRLVRLSPSMREFGRRQCRDPRPMVACTFHFAGWELQTVTPLLLGDDAPEFNTIFRPLDHPGLDAWVQRSRERFGMRLLSRKRGFQEALLALRRSSVVAVLVDQNAGLQGALTTFFGRVCSTTELPGLLADKFHSRVAAVYPRRHAFWRYEIVADPITETASSSAATTIAVNRWLEERLRGDNELCASWLWMHDRWRNQDMPSKRFRLEAKRDLLSPELAARGWPALPRKTRVWIRLPNWLGDVVMALPLLRALRASRPDAEITLIAKPQFTALLSAWGVADVVRPLPARGFAYLRTCWRWRHEYPDVYLLFTNSVRGDLEAWLTGCRQRFGLVRPGKHRPLLTHCFRVPADFDERQHHQLELWTDFLRHFGLAAPPDLAPLNRPAPTSADAPIGFIAGSENNPAKRWPVAHWRALLAQLPADLPVILFGTANDRPITDAIAAGHEARVANLAGRTTLSEYCAKLAACRLLVTNDTGGMHLANALGVPLIALFGPTNPVRTRPVFATPVHILQPPACPPTGGAALADLAPAIVAAAVRARLAATS